jgi:hypothetical protein
MALSMGSASWPCSTARWKFQLDGPVAGSGTRGDPRAVYLAVFACPDPIQPAQMPHGPLHVLIDSTGLQVYGAGQWLEAKHGAGSRRKCRKLHLAVDAGSGMIVA